MAEIRASRPFAIDLGERPLTEPTAAAQPWQLELVFMPQTRPLSAPDDEIACLVERSALSSSKKRTQAPMEEP